MKNQIKEYNSNLPARDCKLVADKEKIKLMEDKHPLLFVSFPGSGLVGNIVASELVKQLNMIQIGFVTTRYLPPIAVFYDGILKHPFRLYYSAEKNLIVAQCEVPFNKSSTYQDLARLLSKWAMDIGIEEVCTIQGIEGSIDIMSSDKPDVFIAAEKEVFDRIHEKSGVEKLPRGLILGPEAAILNEGLNNRLNCYALLVPVVPQIPNPEGAIAVIEELNKIYELEVKTDKLMEEAQNIRDKLKELMQKTQQQHSQMTELSQTNPSQKMYM